MNFSLSQVAPWGRSLPEYVQMFNLTQKELDSQILGCADGPASFNSEMNELGHIVVSIDPLYQFSREQIEQQIGRSYYEIMDQVVKNKNDFVWDKITSPEQLGQLRMESMYLFLNDYDVGKQEQRYLDLSLPVLPFSNKMFQLALCSHFLFLYSDHLSLEFHMQAIVEMCRVAEEVRIFPLLNIAGLQSIYVHRVYSELKKMGFSVVIEKVSYEFQHGGNKMMRICK